jgi:diguanylate cyclase (GGDEF)-like protein/PAS domain S-box-containing protein
VTLSEDVTVGAVAHRTEPLPAATSCEEVHHLFHRDRTRASVVVHHGSGVLLVNRRPFYEVLTGPFGYGRTLFSRRPVRHVVPDDALTVDASVPLEVAGLRLLKRDASSSDDILVRLDGGWGTVPAVVLQRHLADRHAARAESLARSEARFRLLVEHAVDVISILDVDGRLLYRSREIPGVVDLGVGDHAFANLHPEDVPKIADLFERCVADPTTELQGEFRLVGADDSVHVFGFNARNCFDDPAIGGVVVNYRDITERRALEDRLLHNAFHDPLTGLPNRELLFERAEHALDRLERVPGRVAALYLDLDGFKACNDELGHDFGDAVIIGIADRLRTHVRKGDTLARIGGDEFVVLADACDEGEAEELGRRLVEAVAEPLRVWDRAVSLSGSIGVAVTSAPASVAVLLQQADSAMYAAKAAGRNRMERYDPAIHEARQRRSRLATDLPLALERGQLRLAYQPIVGAGSRLATGVEALLRWDHPTLGPVPPLEFITIAEQRGLIDRIGGWVLEEACRQLAAWDASGASPRYLSVNVSPGQLDDPAFADVVQATLAATGVDARRLQLEVTETALATDTPGRIGVLAALRGLGVAVAIDDFGTGYSSLSYLSHLPIDVVKLDRTFVADLDRSSDAGVLLRSIVELAHSLGHRVTAEGVETDEHCRLLRAMGCDDLQGYLFAEPEAPAAAGERFREAHGLSLPCDC